VRANAGGASALRCCWRQRLAPGASPRAWRAAMVAAAAYQRNGGGIRRGGKRRIRRGVKNGGNVISRHRTAAGMALRVMASGGGVIS